MIAPQVVDWVNGGFECIGAVCNWLNVVAYFKHREVKGVYWPTTIFYVAWGLWNLLYYPSLGQIVSFIGGVFLTLGNVVWISLVIYDRFRYENHQSVS